MWAFDKALPKLASRQPRPYRQLQKHSKRRFFILQGLKFLLNCIVKIAEIGSRNRTWQKTRTKTPFVCILQGLKFLLNFIANRLGFSSKVFKIAKIASWQWPWPWPWPRDFRRQTKQKKHMAPPTRWQSHHSKISASPISRNGSILPPSANP